MSSTDTTLTVELRKYLEEARGELSILNLEENEWLAEGSGSSSRSSFQRTYTLEAGQKAARNALEICKKISSMLREKDQRAAHELDENIREAQETLAEDESSPVSLDEWFKSELIPLLNRFEQAVHDATSEP